MPASRAFRLSFSCPWSSCPEIWGSFLHEIKHGGRGGLVIPVSVFFRRLLLVAYVYFMKRSSDGAVKIGVSKDPESRCADLQTGNSSKLKVIAKFPFDSRAKAFDWEKYLHRKFRRHRLQGEWFRYGAIQQIRDIVQSDKRWQSLMTSTHLSEADRDSLQWARNFL